MKPYYDQEGVTLYQGGTLEIAPTLKGFNLIIADPPYRCTPLKWDKLVQGWSTAIQNCLLPTGSIWVFGQMRNIPLLFESFSEWKFAQEIVWEKHNVASPVTQRRFARVHEFALQFYKNKWSDVHAEQQMTHGHPRKKTTRRQAGDHVGTFKTSHYDSTSRIARSVQKIRSCHHNATHPTQKPIDLLRLLIRYSCPPGGHVLDPFMGSGSVMKAAKLEGRKATGIDLQKISVEGWIDEE